VVTFIERANIPKGPFTKGHVPSRIGTLSLLYIYKKWSKPSINTINQFPFSSHSNTLSRTLDSPLTRLQNSPSSTTPEANPLRRQTELAEFASNETRRELYRDRGRTKKSEATEARCLCTTMAKANSWRIHEFAQRKKKSKYCDGASISTSPCIDPSQA